MATKITDLPKREFSGDIISDCCYLKNSQDPMHYVKVKDVFEWIKTAALKEEGLTVECIDNNIIFIKGRKND